MAMARRNSPACIDCDSMYECESLCAAGVAALKDVEIAALKAEVAQLMGARDRWRSRWQEMDERRSVHQRRAAKAEVKVQELETEIKFNVETIPDHVIVREGGGSENWAASLAVSVRKLVKQVEGDSGSAA